MLWAVRGTHTGGDDFTIVVEADTKAEAEYRVLKRGLPVVIVEEATQEDVRVARAARLLWKYTPDAAYTAFGQQVGRFQLAALMLCGVMTAGTLLHAQKKAPGAFGRQIGSAIQSIL